MADTFDAITSTRAYRNPRTHKQALDVLQREGGTQLDPDAVAAFVAYYSARRSIGWTTAIAAASQRVVSGLGGVQSGLAVGVAPLTQTACGVGAIALIGACVGGATSPAPTQSTAAAEPPAVERQVVSHAGDATTPAPAPQGKADGRVGEGMEPVERRGDRGSPAPVTDRGAPRAFSAPLTSPAPDRDSSGGELPGGVDPPQVPALPTLPNLPDVREDPTSVLEPVTDLPQPQVPSVGVP